MLTRYIVAWYFVVCFSLTATTAFGQPACRTEDSNSCDVYTKCIEENCRCNATQWKYPASFGHKYCVRFSGESRFSQLGKQWRDKTLACLKEEISRAYVNNQGPPCNCERIHKAAIASHTKCYTSAPSFCLLSDDDIRRIARIVDAADFALLGASGAVEVADTWFQCFLQVGVPRGFQIADVFAGETIAEGGEIARTHILNALSHGVQLAIQKARQDIEQKFRELIEKYRRRIP